MRPRRAVRYNRRASEKKLSFAHKAGLYSLNFIRETVQRHPRPDARASVIKYRNASEFEAAGFRVKRGMTINRRFFKLNE